MATSTPISGLTALGAAPATNDLVALVDVSDPNQAATGTTKKMTVANLFTTPAFTTSVVVTGSAAATVAVGPNGATNPALQVDASAASLISGLKVTGAASGSPVTLASISSGVNANLQIDAKGSGTIAIAQNSSGQVTITPTLNLLGSLNLVTGASTVARVNLSTTVTAAGATRNWAWLTNQSANGNVELWVSNAEGGDPLAAGAVAVTISGAKAVTFAGNIALSTAVSKLVPGATSFSARNNADSVDNLLIADSGNVTIRGTLTLGDTTLLHSSVALTSGPTASSPTLTVGPVSGNPTKWVPISDNGTTRYIPTW